MDQHKVSLVQRILHGVHLLVVVLVLEVVEEPGGHFPMHPELFLRHGRLKNLVQEPALPESEASFQLSRQGNEVRDTRDVPRLAHFAQLLSDRLRPCWVDCALHPVALGQDGEPHGALGVLLRNDPLAPVGVSQVSEEIHLLVRLVVVSVRVLSRQQHYVPVHELVVNDILLPHDHVPLPLVRVVPDELHFRHPERPFPLRSPELRLVKQVLWFVPPGYEHFPALFLYHGLGVLHVVVFGILEP
mmetsp:Transcript_3290/g.5534  ORF Transcript_3290/g.5534 Transcript_3290/m.5534 type:complete len:244 (-) Transcript_3290:41-772(-)